MEVAAPRVTPMPAKDPWRQTAISSLVLTSPGMHSALAITSVAAGGATSSAGGSQPARWRGFTVPHERGLPSSLHPGGDKEQRTCHESDERKVAVQ